MIYEKTIVYSIYYFNSKRYILLNFSISSLSLIKQSADEVERILLKKQYRELIGTYHDLENQINDLLNKKQRC